MGALAKQNKNQDSFHIDDPKIERSVLSPDALKKIVLGLVTDEKYDEAISELESFLTIKSEYPQFRSRSLRYIKHSIDLVHAIRAKKRFPGIHSLTRSKLQELNEKTMDHFNELAFTLRKVEIIRLQLQSQDGRSTVWIMRAFVHSVAIIALVALVMEVSDGLYKTGLLVLDDGLQTSINFIFGLFGQ